MQSKWLRVSGWGAAAGALVLLCPAAAHADAGIPMMPVQNPVLLLFLLPVILIETVYLRVHLGTLWRRTAIAAAAINLCTTALGYPLAWGMYKGLEQFMTLPERDQSVFESLQSLPLWLCERLDPGWQGMQREPWPALVVFIVLLLPSFFFSGVVKAWLTGEYDLLHYRGSVRDASWTATRLSYLFLGVSGCAALYLIHARM